MDEPKASSTYRDDLTSTLKSQLSPYGAYRSLGGVVLDGAGHIVEALTFRQKRRRRTPEEKPISHWYGAAVVMLVVLLLGLGISLVLEEDLSPRAILFSVWLAALGSLLLVVNRSNIAMFKSTFYGPGSPLDVMVLKRDLKDLQTWLNTNFSLLRPGLSGVVLGPGVGVLLYYVWLVKNGEVFHWGPFAIAVLSGIQSVWCLYYVYPFFVVLPTRLSRYKLELFPLDPSCSQVVEAFSQLSTGAMYVTLVYMIGFIASLSYFRIVTPGTSLLLVIVAWVPVLALYALSQSGLSKTISRVKWETLDGIQAKIVKIQSGEGVPTKEELEYLDVLVKHHERIRGTRNSAVDLRARLSFLNTLVLPLLAFAIANWHNLKELIEGALSSP